MSAVIRPRVEVERKLAVVHGGFSESCNGEALLDFSANINPYGPSPLVREALHALPIDRHPEPRAMPLRQALAAHVGATTNQVLVGNGSIDLIYQLVVAFVRPHDRVLIVEPTFGEYAAAATLMGADIVRYRAEEANGFALDADQLLYLAQQHRPRLIFLCNPNNPTGSYVSRALVERLLHTCPTTLTVLDESYVRFVANAWSAKELLPVGNLLLLRSLTKDYALTGLRVGYAVGTASVIAALERVQPPWSVNSFAQAGALGALNDDDHLRRTITQLRQAQGEFVHKLEELKYTPLPSSVHFFLLPVPSAVTWTQQLRTRGILVRDCSSFGLPTYVRIAPRQPHDNQRFVRTLAELGVVP